MKVSLALAGIALASAAVVTVFLAVLQGAPQWGQLLLFVVTAVLAFAASLLLWLVGVRQLRVERTHVNKSMLKELMRIERASKGDIEDLGEGVAAVRDRVVVLDERQRNSLNVVSSEASIVRRDLDVLIQTLKSQDESIGDIRHSLNGVSELRDDLDSLRTLIETESVSVAGSARETSDELKELRTLVRHVASALEIVDARDRKMLSLLQSEIRDSAARSDDVKRALSAEGAKSTKMTKTVDEASSTVRKMHNFLRRDGSIQIALDRFTAAERRMLAAVEAAGLDQGDQIAALKTTFDEIRVQEKSAYSRLGNEVRSGLEELHGQLGSSLVGLGADLNGLRDHVTGITERELRLVESLSHKSDELSVNLDVRLRSLEERFVKLWTRFDELSPIGEAASGHARHESELVGASDLPSLAELTQACDTVNKTVARAQTGRLERYIKRQSIDVIRQVEALLQLVPRVESQLRRYPPSGWWALPADTLLFLSDYINRERPHKILEVGSGSSTVWTGTFAKQVGAEIVSLEHDADYVQKTRALVNEFDLQDVATVHHAPLRPIELDGDTFDWYDPAVISTLEGPFDILIVDGPPEATGARARMPALPMLEHLLSEECLILLDDTHRPDEQDILREWIVRYPDFEEFRGDLMRTGIVLRKEGAY